MESKGAMFPRGRCFHHVPPEGDAFKGAMFPQGVMLPSSMRDHKETEMWPTFSPTSPTFIKKISQGQAQTSLDSFIDSLGTTVDKAFRSFLMRFSEKGRLLCRG